MDYYIQGNKEKAAEIKAAFEKLKIDISCYSMAHDEYLYYSSDGLLYFERFSNTLLNIFKSHPGYKELELSVKPKFKVGKWVVYNCASVWQVNGIDWNMPIPRYELINSDGDKLSVPFTSEYNLKEWTIADAKDGDVLACSDWLFILKQFNVKGNNHKTYCHYDLTLNRFKDDIDSYMVSGSDEYHPATKEQRDTLFAKMNEAGYEWDAEKKELKKIQPHYDIANFHAGMPVLVRDYNKTQWGYVQFSHYVGGESSRFNACGNCWCQCIPFEGNEHLLGTTDMCDEMYVNW